MYSPIHCHEHMAKTSDDENLALENSTETATSSKSKLLRPQFLEVDCHYEKVDVLSLGFHEV